MALLPLLVDSRALPWRMRNGLERWVESRCRRSMPGVYRWLHFGRAGDPLEPITRGPLHHFFGYYDKSPWNASGNLVLAHEAAFNDRPPKAGDSVTIGVVHVAGQNDFEPLASSSAWNWQQGAMLQWHPSDPDGAFIHNDCRDGIHVGIVRATDGREIRVYDRPIYAITPDGRHALSVNFARLQTHRPGYGYTGSFDRWSDDRAPSEDGIHLVDLANGASRLVLSLATLASTDPRESMRQGFHYINHLQPSPGGKRIAFFHVWSTGEAKWEVRLYTMASDGTGLRCVLDSGRVSHYDWLDDGRILVWAHQLGRGDRFLICDDCGGRPQVFAEGALTEDGHCSFSPDRSWILNDTYPDEHDMRTLMLLRFRDQKRVELARLYSPKARWWGEIRCDLHPRWNRDGTKICLDSVHDGTRQMYVMDVSPWVR